MPIVTVAAVTAEGGAVQNPSATSFGALVAIPEITEFNIGHNIISRAVFTGLYRAVEEMIATIR